MILVRAARVDRMSSERAAALPAEARIHSSGACGIALHRARPQVDVHLLDLLVRLQAADAQVARPYPLIL